MERCHASVEAVTNSLGTFEGTVRGCSSSGARMDNAVLNDVAAGTCFALDRFSRPNCALIRFSTLNVLIIAGEVLLDAFIVVSEQHLARYVAESVFRYSNRKISDFERALEALKGIEGKRLTYRPSDKSYHPPTAR